MRKLLLLSLLACAAPAFAQDKPKISADAGPADAKGKVVDEKGKLDAKGEIKPDYGAAMKKTLAKLEKSPKKTTYFLFCDGKEDILVLGHEPTKELRASTAKRAGGKCDFYSGVVFYNDDEGEFYFKAKKIKDGLGPEIGEAVKKATGREIRAVATTANEG